MTITMFIKLVKHVIHVQMCEYIGRLIIAYRPVSIISGMFRTRPSTMIYTNYIEMKEGMG